MSVIHDYLKNNKTAHLFPHGVPGEEWWRGFLNNGLHLYPDQIFNCDETSFSMCGRPTKVITKRGAKSPQFVGGTGSRRENITIQMCVSASGKFLPPYILNTGQRLMFDLTQGGPLGTRYGVAPKGWMTEVNFLDWFQNQLIPSLPSEIPVLLVMDGHQSHIKYEVRQLAKKHSIEIAKLPSHTTHLLQPLDHAVIKSMKKAYDIAAHGFFRRYITKRDFPALLAETWKSYKPQSAVNGFKKLVFILSTVMLFMSHQSVIPHHFSSLNLMLTILL